MRNSLGSYLLLLTVIWAGAVVLSPDAWASQAAHTTVDLLLDHTAARPGDTVWAGVRLRPDDKWHVYWRNPGDSGLSPKLYWELPSGLKAGDIQWPYPARIRVSGLTSYGYEKEVTLLVPLDIAADAKPGRYNIKLKVDYLTCQVDCIPGTVHLKSTLDIGDRTVSSTNSDGIASMALARNNLPLDEGSWNVEARFTSSELKLIFRQPRPPASAHYYFFPYSSSLIDHDAPQAYSAGTLTAELSPVADLSPAAVEGVMVSDVPLAGTKDRYAAFIRAPVVTTSTGKMNFWLACLLALAGGMVLNLMPCVLPVLSVKVLALVRHSRDPRALWTGGLLYTLGIVLSFVAVAGIMLILRAAGREIGWGFQFQSVWFVWGMIGLLTLFAMSLFGFYEIAPPEMAGRERLSRWGAFGTGVLATILATPCTAPFMGTALGFAVLLPAAQALAIFVCLGVGLALPFLALSVFPQALTLIPKPGPWMKAFQRVMGLALLATALWLVGVLRAQCGICGCEAAALTIFLLVAASILFGLTQRGRKGLLIGTLLLAGAAVGLGIWRLETCPADRGVKASAAASFWRPYSDEALAAAQRRGQAVFINFTAKWCLTCQVNAVTVFKAPPVVAALSAAGVTALQADWTSFNDEITRALARYGYTSVPLYVVYPAGDKRPVILPVVLTPEQVIEALKGRKDSPGSSTNLKRGSWTDPGGQR